jgi:hypothetical protein
MKLVRYRFASGEKPGLILDGEIFDLSGSFAALNPRAPTLDDIEAIAAVPAKALVRVEKGVTLGPPLRGIGKIIGVGLNYRDHAGETGLPLPRLFLKATSALCFRESGNPRRHLDFSFSGSRFRGDERNTGGRDGRISAALLPVNFREEVVLP